MPRSPGEGGDGLRVMDAGGVGAHLARPAAASVWNWAAFTRDARTQVCSDRARRPGGRRSRTCTTTDPAASWMRLSRCAKNPSAHRAHATGRSLTRLDYCSRREQHLLRGAVRRQSGGAGRPARQKHVARSNTAASVRYGVDRHYSALRPFRTRRPQQNQKSISENSPRGASSCGFRATVVHSVATANRSVWA